MMKMGPGEAEKRIRVDSEHEWHWPLVPPEGDEEGVELTERWRAHPSHWVVLRTIGKAESAEIAAALPQNSLDDLRTASTNSNRVVEAERGSGAHDREIIRSAYHSVDMDIADNVTRGKPKVEAVRLEMERILLEETGQKKYPAWLTSKLITNALEAGS
jgi:hypothetical protein